MKIVHFFCFLLLFPVLAQARIQLDKIKLPAHFKIKVYQEGLKGARAMTLGDQGTLFVGSTTQGSVYAVTPDHHLFTIAEKLDYPNGVAFRNGALYVAEVTRILKYDQIESHLDHPPKPSVVYSGFPDNRADHFWKFIAFGPDGKLYVPIGFPCDVCAAKDPYGTISRMNPDGKSIEIIERGIRNTVGFDWDPVDHVLWFTDNGRDYMGDDLPSDELNRAPKTGMNFGFPYCHQGDVLDPEFGKGKSCADYTPPEQKLGAHVASLGMRFYTGNSFPKEYRNQIFIAEHGSWNRSVPIGYRVALARLDKDRKGGKNEVFAEGWLMKNGKPWGRPVDVQIAKDGSLLVSDDFAGAIYQIYYEK